MKNSISYNSGEAKLDSRKSRWRIPGVRYLFSFLSFTGFVVIYAVRVNINVAIVAMINSTAVYDPDKNKSLSHECAAPHKNSSQHDSHEKDGEFDWSPKLQAVVLGAFYYGYCISQIPGGRMAELFSGKVVFGVGVLASALLTLLSPIAAQLHVGALVAVRILEGLAQGVTLPAMYTLLGKWTPDTEKAVMTTIMWTGINIGTVLSMPLTGILCKSDLFGGWPSAFYVIGLFGCLWCVVWFLLVTETPQSHPLITEKELRYITQNQTIDINAKLPSIPWRKILTSVPVWGLVLTQTGFDFNFYITLTDLPTYFATILHFDIEKNGVWSSVPHLLQTVVGLTASVLADLALRKQVVSTKFIRKFLTTVTGFGCAALALCLCFTGCDATLTVVCFVMMAAVGGVCYSGYNLSHLDLSPEYAGTLMGISNTVSNLMGFVAPLVVGSLIEDQQTLHQWRIVFILYICVSIFSAMIFNFFVTADKQEWSTPDEERQNILNSASTELIHQKQYKTLK